MFKQILREWNPGWKPLRWKATLIALPILALVIPLLILSLPYLEILNDMAVQPKAKTQGHYGWFSNEIIMVERPPVPGTVPANVSAEAYEYVVTEKDEEKAATFAGETLENPLKRTRDVIEKGRWLYERVCITCHGDRAEGNGPIIGPDWFPAPPSLHTPQARKYPDGRIWHIITRGQNKMPSYAYMLNPEERWQIVHWIRVMQRAKQMAEEGN
ncbi:MAG: cytochrome c [Planctomycetota bacterium]|nr:cytochrome c [Planctomycetota bacterium]